VFSLALRKPSVFYKGAEDRPSQRHACSGWDKFARWRADREAETTYAALEDQSLDYEFAGGAADIAK